MPGLDRVFAEIANHCDGQLPEFTLLRLIEKQLLGRYLEPVRAALEAGALRITEQHWPVDDLRPLWSHNEAGAPQFDTGPVVVLRVGGIDMLIDGHNRRRKRLRERDQETQAVLLVEVD